jgi:hypothetical protein
MKSMPQACNQEDLRYGHLYAAYRSEWQAFAQETRRWRLLEDEEQITPGRIHQAKVLAESAEQRYRRARNALWEHIMIHSSLKKLALA